jgi:hypothetical protein
VFNNNHEHYAFYKRLEGNVVVRVENYGNTVRDRIGMHHRANSAMIVMSTITDNIRFAKKKEVTTHDTN